MLEWYSRKVCDNIVLTFDSVKLRLILLALTKYQFEHVSYVVVSRVVIHRFERILRHRETFFHAFLYVRGSLEVRTKSVSWICYAYKV
jgi:hypothetical protein